MNIPLSFLDASRWQGLNLDVLMSLYEDGTEAPLPSAVEPETVYQPVGRVPSVVFCRTSDSEKRLESQLESVVVASGPWGQLCEVQGGGGVIGLVLLPATGVFCGAHVLPDMVHLVVCEDDLAENSIISEVHESKTIRAFLMGPPTGDRIHDFLMTTKARWFRNRINPKYLGFSKDEKV